MSRKNLEAALIYFPFRTSDQSYRLGLFHELGNLYTTKGESRLSTQKPLNIWHYKPWWCQPWSIILTGITIIATSWAIAKTMWLTIPISLLILVWWTYFLIILPELLRRSQIERE